MGSMDQCTLEVERLRSHSKLGGTALRRRLSAAPAALLATGLLAVAWAGPLAAPAAAATTGWNGGRVVAWGDNTSHQTDVPAAARSNVNAISGGGDFALALTMDGHVVAWGNDTYGQTDVPAGLSNTTAISAGKDFAVALESDGTVAAWGADNVGQTNVPAGLSNVAAISAGCDHVLALKSDGSVVAWGGNGYGQTTVPTHLIVPVVSSVSGFGRVLLAAMMRLCRSVLMRSAPTITASTSPLAIRCPAMLSVTSVQGMPSCTHSQAVSRAPCR